MLREQPSFWKIVLTQGDRHDVLFTIVDAEGKAVNLTDFTIYFNARGIDAGNANALISKAMTVDDAAGGKVRVRLTEADLAIPGNYRAEIKLQGTVAGSDVITTEKGTMIVEEKVA